MNSVVGPEASFQIYLLASFALGLLLAAKCLVQMAFPGLRAHRCVEWMAGIAAVVVVFILGLDALVYGDVLVSVATPSLALLSTGLGVNFVVAHLGVSLLKRSPRQLALQPLAWLTVALTLGVTAWSSHRYTVGIIRAEMNSAFCPVEGELSSIQNLVAVTDRDREVVLYRWDKDGFNTDSPVPTPAELENLQANCHGWVFTGGKHLLKSDGVQRILDDNGYQLCDNPRPGDLIVYRDEAGEIVHTGQVKAGFLGSNLVESKWGMRGQFLHGPEQQPYGNRYSYYRSSRQGHDLVIRAARPTMSIASRSLSGRRI